MIDLITNLDMSAFHSLGGWDKMLSRLEMEWKECVHEAPTILSAEVKPTQDQLAGAEGEEQGTEECRVCYYSRFTSYRPVQGSNNL